MKPLIIAFVVLLVVLLGVYWMDGRFGNNVVSKVATIEEKMLYFEPEISLTTGGQGELNLMANYSGAAVTGFNIEFGYDSTVIKIDGVSVDGNFNKQMSSNIDQNFGKVSIKANTGFAPGALRSGMQKLATIQLSGLKKGGTIMTSVRRSEVSIWENGQNVEGNFTMKPFKVTVK